MVDAANILGIPLERRAGQEHELASSPVIDTLVQPSCMR